MAFLDTQVSLVPILCSSVFLQLSQLFLNFLSFSSTFSVVHQHSQYFLNTLSFSSTFLVFPQFPRFFFSQFSHFFLNFLFFLDLEENHHQLNKLDLICTGRFLDVDMLSNGHLLHILKFIASLVIGRRVSFVSNIQHVVPSKLPEEKSAAFPFKDNMKALILHWMYPFLPPANKRQINRRKKQKQVQIQVQIQNLY